MVTRLDEPSEAVHAPWLGLGFRVRIRVRARARARARVRVRVRVRTGSHRRVFLSASSESSTW